MTIKWHKSIILMLLFLGSCKYASALSVIYTPNYPNLGVAGGHRSDCSVSASSPATSLSQQMTLIADSHLAVGHVLYEWPDFMSIDIVCPEGANPVANISAISDIKIDFYPLFGTTGFDSLTSTFKTNNSGIGLKLYVKLERAGNKSVSGGTNSLTSTEVRPHNTNDRISVGSEYLVESSSVGFRTLFQLGNNVNHFSANDHFVTYKVRGQLIKIGDIAPSSNLKLSFDSTSFYFKLSGGYSGDPKRNETVRYQWVVGGEGITVVEPSCRLGGTTDYQISMGRWVNVAGNNVGSLPVYGSVNPVGLDLECSGKLDNVEFSFQDTGSSPLTNRNIGVYDNGGGQLIEGLEIEMSYGGARLNIHKMGEDVTTYKINTGAHGNIKTNASDLSYLPSNAEFGARFVQRSAIKRNGVPYTGPVTGKVNMFVTYY